MKKLKSVLLVDDDDVIRFTGTRIIRKIDLAEEVISVNNGREALSYLQQHCLQSNGLLHECPSLILLDISMPVMNGFEFLEAFEGLEFTIRPLVVLLSTSQNPQDRERAKHFQVAGFLHKPLQAEALTALLEQKLGA